MKEKQNKSNLSYNNLANFEQCWKIYMYLNYVPVHSFDTILVKFSSNNLSLIDNFESESFCPSKTGDQSESWVFWRKSDKKLLYISKIAKSTSHQGIWVIFSIDLSPVKQLLSVPSQVLHSRSIPKRCTNWIILRSMLKQNFITH